MTRARTAILLGLAVTVGPSCHHPAHAPGGGGGGADTPRFLRSFQATHASRAERQCAAADYQPMAAREQEPPAARAEAWAGVLASCWLDWRAESGDAIDRDALAAYAAYATALADAGYPHDCEDVLSPVTTPYPDGLGSVEVPEELQEQVDAVTALGERCATEADAELSAFAPPTCPGDACFAFAEAGPDEGTPADHADDAGDDDGDDLPPVVCPEVEQRTAGGPRRLHADAGPLLDVSFCCGLSSITTATDGGRRYLLIRPSGEDSMFIRECSGGTASMTPEAIYQVAGDRLILAADRSVMWH